MEITILNGGGAVVFNTGSSSTIIGTTLNVDNATCCTFGSDRNTSLLLFMEVLTTLSRSAGSARSVPRLASNEPTSLPPVDSPSRRFTGTIAISGLSGNPSCSSRYARSAPPHTASTTSLRVTPVAFLIARKRSTGQDCAAHRRAPAIGTLNMVFGAPNGRVSCCWMIPLRARL